MKKSITLLLIVVFAIVKSFGQANSDPDPTQSILPPSPTAAAFAKYVDHPVNHHTGTPSISIPLCELSGRGVSVPVSLSYHAGGVKVDEVASNVGLGWSLNAGGVVTRTVMGKADEGPHGFLQKGASVPYPTVSTTTLQEFATGNWDAQPDVFNFNFGGYSGKFVLDALGNRRIIPHQDLKIDYTLCTGCSYPLNGQIISIIITTPDGVKYTFGTTAAIEYSKATSNGCKIRNYDDPIITAWYLIKIENPRTGDYIDFNYATNQISYDLNYTESYQYPASTGQPSGCGSASSQKCITVKTDYGVYLTSITSSTGQLTFTSGGSRSDLSGFNTRITGIALYQGVVQTKSFTFNQSFVMSSGTLPANASNFDNYRMYLDGISMFGEGGVLVNTHAFTYKNRTGLPPRLSYQQDHWGYHNNNSVNQLTPAPDNSLATLNYIQQHFSTFTPANREPHATNAQNGILEKITYPTGGFVQYQYEGNELAVCSNQTTTQNLTATANAIYHGDEDDWQFQPFTLDYGQPITITYKILKIGFRQFGARIRIVDASNGQVYEKAGSTQVEHPAEIPAGGGYGTEIITLPAGNYTLEAYTFEDGANWGYSSPFNQPEQAYISVAYQKNVNNYVTNVPTGGLRIKQITVDDGDATTSNNIIKAYKYHRASETCTNGSSAAYFGKPVKYLTNEASIIPGSGGSCSTQQCDFLRLGSASMRNLTGYSGNIVGYEEAWELDGLNAENGKKYYKFNIILDGDPQMGPNPDNVFLNTPQIDNAYKSGKPLQEKVFNASNQILWEKLYEYNFSETVNKTSVKAMYSQRRYSLPCAPTPVPTNTIEYAVEWYDVVSQWVYLTKETERTYAPGTANFVEKITDYQYDVPSGRHTMPVATITTNSDGIQYVQRSKYPKEYTTTTLSDWAAYAIKDLVDANIINEPIETVQLVKANSSSPEQAVRGRIVKYHTFGSQRILPREIWLLGTTTPIGSFPYSSINGSGLFTFSGNYYHYSTTDTYDMQGNLQTYARKDDQVSSLIWGHNGLLPTAAVKNATPPEIAYTSFEEESQVASANGGWVLTGTTGGWNSALGFAQTGLKGFNLSDQRYAERSSLATGTYVVGFWYKGGQVRILKGSTLVAASPTSTGWAWFECKVPMAGEVLKLTGNSSAVYIDEARVHPVDALMTTYSYDAQRKLLISVADPSGTPMTYEYDFVQRLKTVFDVNRHVQQALEYQYKIGGAALNSVKTLDVLISGVADHAAAIALPDADVRPVFAYLDGLGRPIQTVAVKESAGTKDMVSYQEYDAFGRTPYQYLPYTETSNSGAYRTSPSSGRSSFYLALFGSSDAGFAYNRTEFEASPLNRPLIQRAPGILYNPKPVQTSYTTNGANEVRNFKASGYYSANTLIKIQVTDPDGKLSTTYTDKLGRKVMTNQGNARTYYVYDDFGNLQAVLQPKFSDYGHLSPTILWDNTSLNNLCFKYTYDERQRVSTKTIPGAGTTTFYYDRLDRLVLTVDANNVKLFTKYDILGRPVLTGRYTGNLTPNATNGLYESATTGNDPLFYTQNQTFPSTLLRIFTMTYYDAYDWDLNGTVDANEQYAPLPTGITAPYQNYVQPYNWVRGKPTCVKSALLPTDPSFIISNYYRTASYYDIKGRVIQTKVENHLGGTDVTNVAYSFAGWVKNTHRVHSATPPGGVLTTLTIQERFEHDHSGRVLKAFHKMNTAAEVQISESTYSELDLLSSKKLHKNGSLYVQTLDYTYNIRNWLTRLNDPTNMGTDAWAMELVYGTGDQSLNSNYASGQNANYNGNITMIKSRTQGQSVTPTYGFMYDGLNRLTAAYYGEKGTSTYSNLDRYTEYQSYDLNGNILSLDRYGLAGGSAGAIDDLTYTYTLNSNQISGITESVTNTTFRDKGFKYYSSGTYTYDAAGNVTNEPSKGAVIAYNYFNLPRLFTLGSNTIEIEYDGGGNKLRKTVKQGSTTLYIQNYLGGIEYNSGHLEAVFHAEGRVYNTNVGTGNTTPAFRYEYAIRDHLGNTRILFTDKNNNGVLNVTAGTDNEIIQENQYYPFGMNQEGAFMNDAAARDTKYQYNSKELNDDFGLNWNDYGARWYDASIGRWNGVDFLAEKMMNQSPYTYVLNNPVILIDPSGMYPIYGVNGEYLGDDGRSGGGDLAFVGTVSKRDKNGNAIEFGDLVQFTDRHKEFQISANLVKEEAADGGAEAALWIAHTANNASKDNSIDWKKKNNSLYDQLMDSEYSTTEPEDRTPLKALNNSSGAKDARAAVINVLIGGADPTGGSVLWDGLDFWDSGLEHNKFNEYTRITISSEILIPALEYASSQRNRDKVNKNFVVQCAFYCEQRGKDFSEAGNKGRNFSLNATKFTGGSIFWKTGKK